MRLAGLGLMISVLMATLPAASEIRQLDYAYSYEFAKDPGSDTVYAICNACPPAERLTVRPKELPLVVKVVIPEPQKLQETKNTAAEIKGVEESMKKVFPNVGIESFRESEIKGLYEVAAGNQIFYFHPDGYLIFGEIWSKEGKSLTAERRSLIASEKRKNVQLIEQLLKEGGEKK